MKINRFSAFLAALSFAIAAWSTPVTFLFGLGIFSGVINTFQALEGN